MKKRALSMFLVLLLCLEVTVPILATEKNTIPEIKITWLPGGGKPVFYNRDLNWLIVGDVGIIDLTANKKIEEYDYVRDFSEGLAFVAKLDANGNRKYSFIDKSGTVVIPLEYDDVSNFSEDLAFVSKRDINGNEKYGFVDKSGTVVVPLEYDEVSDFSEGLAFVTKLDANGSKKYGFIDKTGAVVIPLEYDDYGIDSWNSFSEGLARVSKFDANGNKKYGFIDKSGTVVVPLEYDLASRISEGLAYVEKDDANGNRKMGFVDKTGAVVVPVVYDSCGQINNGLCYVEKGMSWGIFENPYWISDEVIESDSHADFPILLALLVGVVAVTAVVAALVMKKKKTVPADAQKAEQTAEQAREIICACGMVNPATAKFCSGCGRRLDGSGL